MTYKKGELELVILPQLDRLYGSLVSFLKTYAEQIIIVLASVIAYFGWVNYFDSGLILSYNDSMSHLDIARRVVDGLKPGFAQIGSVWLPLPHILMLPTIWNNFFWHSGLSGSLISIFSFIGTTFIIFRFVRRLTDDFGCGFLAAIMFAINPNMIYLQSIPMTESLYIFLFILSCYTVYRWYQTDKVQYLVLAGASLMLASMTRYDGWALFLQAIFVVAIVAFRRGGYSKSEGSLVMLAVMGGYGIALWFLWNQLIFNDPLYFLDGPFSAKVQQLVFESEGRLLTKHDLLLSLKVYIVSAIKNNGALISIISILGMLAMLWKNKLNSKILILSLLLSPLLFNVVSLYTGNSIINLPDYPPYSLFNVRYGILVLPAIVIFAAYIVRKQKVLQLALLTVALMQTIFIYSSLGVITIRDGIAGASAQGMTQTGKWLGDNAEGGLILIAASSHDSLIFQSGFPMDRFVYEGDGKIWEESLDNPTVKIAWVAMHKGDLVYQRMYDNVNFLTNYTRVYDGEFTDIYKYTGPATGHIITTNELP